MASPSPPLKLEETEALNPPPSPPTATPLSILVPITTATAPTTTPSTTSRRLPPPCWTPDETSALIDSYRDKWYSLRRGNLRAAHWQDVADHIHRRCPNVTPHKTAVQCRHKMEKLRKRYRAELNRAKSIPHHRFSSSWVHFSKMEAMEKGPNANAVPLSSPPVSAIVAASQDFNGMENDDGDDDEEEDEDDEEDYVLRSYEQKREFNRDYGRNGLKIKIRENPNSNLNPRVMGCRSKYASINNFSSTPAGIPQFEDGGRYQYGVSRAMMRNNHNSNGSNMNMGMNMSMGGNLNDNEMNMVMMRKKRKEKEVGAMGMAMGNRERVERAEREGREDDGAMEMVEAIRGLGEGFVKMEKMKMEMMRETERMRMEMEMKRTQMILESQHRIVEAFAKGWSDAMNVEDNNGSC